MKTDMIEYIKKHPMWCGAGYLVLLGVLAWLFQSWPGGFWGWLGIAWGWLRETPNGYESASTTIRNLGLFVAAPLALWLAIWRARVADRQSKTAQQQVETSQRQAETAQRSLLNEQYQKGAEMLGSDILSVRLGGIYTLARLAREHPEEYHVQIMRLFCAFVRNPTMEDQKDGEDIKETESISEQGTEEKGDEKPKLREDVREIVRVIRERNDAQIGMEREEEYRLDLCGANLVEAYLGDANLSRAALVEARLNNAFLCGVNLTEAFLFDAELGGEYLGLLDANLTGADLARVIGLTQRQLDTARADPNKPPRLDNTFDAETGKQLVWHGKPLNE